MAQQASALTGGSASLVTKRACNEADRQFLEGNGESLYSSDGTLMEP